jgi:hypothetical protein
MNSEPRLPFPHDPAAVETPAEPASEASLEDERVASSRGSGRRVSKAHLWLRRAGVLLFVFLCATLGVMLMIVPWRPEWSENRLLAPYPAMRALVASGFIRGVVSGLGLLNVWIGFWEALQYREDE